MEMPRAMDQMARISLCPALSACAKERRAANEKTIQRLASWLRRATSCILATTKKVGTFDSQSSVPILVIRTVDIGCFPTKHFEATLKEGIEGRKMSNTSIALLWWGTRWVDSPPFSSSPRQCLGTISNIRLSLSAYMWNKSPTPAPCRYCNKVFYRAIIKNKHEKICAVRPV